MRDSDLTKVNVNFNSYFSILRALFECLPFDFSLDFIREEANMYFQTRKNGIDIIYIYIPTWVVLMKGVMFIFKHKEFEETSDKIQSFREVIVDFLSD